MMIEYGLIWPETKVLGPGTRFVIWTQGCPRRCYKCASPELQTFGKGKTIEVCEIADMIIHSQNIDGITISGGEPMIQADAILKLLSLVNKERPNLDVILYTGYLLEQLQNKEQKELLNYIDVLIDGEYIHELNDNQGIRGSSNQRIHYFSHKLDKFKDQIEKGIRRREFHVLNSNELLTIGIADKIHI